MIVGSVVTRRCIACADDRLHRVTFTSDGALSTTSTLRCETCGQRSMEHVVKAERGEVLWDTTSKIGDVTQ